MGLIFPENFLWGTATSAFQIEMGIGEPASNSDWYVWVHDADNIKAGRVSGHFPEDGPGSWELFPEDFRIAREELRTNAIRLSFDWSRIFPKSTEIINVNVKRDVFGNIHEVIIDEHVMEELSKLADIASVRKYRQMLEKAKELGLTVFLTLYHWPLPLWLHNPIECRDNIENAENKGWLDQRTIVEFAKYVAFVAKEFGDLVDIYATINEPRISSQHGYMTERGEFPPGLNDPELFQISMKHQSVAHNVAYKLVKTWDTESMSEHGPATVGVVCVLQYYEPKDPLNPKDVQAAEFVEYMYNEWFLNSIIKGDYDLDLDGIIQSEEQWSHLVSGCDFIGLNYYSRWLVSFLDKGWGKFNFDLSTGEGEVSDYGWETYTEGLGYVLRWTFDRYRRPIYITENGIADKNGEKRIRYILDHLNELHSTIEEGIPVLGYFHWSLFDNFEWSDGYNMHFGLYRVNHETKERIPTNAAKIYMKIALNNALY